MPPPLAAAMPATLSSLPQRSMASKEQTQALTSHVADVHKERQAVQPNWDTLPDCLLGLILAAAGKDCWSVLLK